MITIESHLQQRKAFLQAIKEAHKQLVQQDLNFWKNNLKDIFEHFPDLVAVSWKQGFFYNDENYAFHTTDFTINNLMIIERDYEFSPRQGRKNRDEETTIFLVDSERDEADYNQWLENRYRREKQDDTFILRMKDKYQELIPAAKEITQFICEVYQNLGQRHFADSFGKKAKVTFKREGLLLEDYEDYDATNEGVLEDLVPD